MWNIRKFKRARRIIGLCLKKNLLIRQSEDLFNIHHVYGEKNEESYDCITFDGVQITLKEDANCDLVSKLIELRELYVKQKLNKEI